MEGGTGVWGGGFGWVVGFKNKWFGWVVEFGLLGAVGWVAGFEVGNAEKRFDGRELGDSEMANVTERDREALGWIAEMYAMPVPFIRDLCGISDAGMRKMLFRWRKAGWIENGRLVNESWVWATELGIELFGNGKYRARPPALSMLAHIRATALTRAYLESQAQDGNRWVWESERELRWRAGSEAGPMGLRRHFPDGLAWWGETPVGVEVELSAKGPVRVGMALTAALGSVKDLAKGAAGAARVLYVVSRQAAATVADEVGRREDAGRFTVVELGEVESRGLAWLASRAAEGEDFRARRVAEIAERAAVRAGR